MVGRSKLLLFRQVAPWRSITLLILSRIYEKQQINLGRPYEEYSQCKTFELILQLCNIQTFPNNVKIHPKSM